MMNENLYTQIATPYYGTVARAGRGFENVFIIATASKETGKVDSIRVEAWCGRAANDLSNWLSEKKVEGFIAEDFSLALEKELDKANIWSRWNITGDIHEIESQWDQLKVA